MSIQSKNEIQMDDMISLDSNKQPIQENQEDAHSESQKQDEVQEEPQENVFEYIPLQKPSQIHPKS